MVIDCISPAVAAFALILDTSKALHLQGTEDRLGQHGWLCTALMGVSEYGS